MVPLQFWQVASATSALASDHSQLVLLFIPPEIVSCKNYKPSHKADLRKYHDSSGAKAPRFRVVFGTAEAVPS